MFFLGVVFLVGGVLTCFANIFIGLIFIGIGIALLTSEKEKQNKVKKEEQCEIHQKTKEQTIALRTNELIQEGDCASDAKIKAETEYTINKINEERKIELTLGANEIFCNACSKKYKKQLVIANTAIQSTMIMWRNETTRPCFS